MRRFLTSVQGLADRARHQLRSPLRAGWALVRATWRVSLPLALLLFALPMLGMSMLEYRALGNSSDAFLTYMQNAVLGGIWFDTDYTLRTMQMTAAYQQSRLLAMLNEYALSPLLIAGLVQVYLTRWRSLTPSLRSTYADVRARIVPVLLTGLCVTLLGTVYGFVRGLASMLLSLAMGLLSWVPVLGLAVTILCALLSAALSAVGELLPLFVLSVAYACMQEENLTGRPLLMRMVQFLWQRRAEVLPAAVWLLLLSLGALLVCAAAAVALIAVGVPWIAVAACYHALVAVLLAMFTAVSVSIFLSRHDDAAYVEVESFVV